MEIKVNLSRRSIKAAIAKLDRYSKDLEKKNEIFVERLLDLGIQVAEEAVSKGTHDMPKRISFYKDYAVPNEHGITGILVGVGETFLSRWIDSMGDEHSDEVYPLAMMEFGSAGFALPWTNAYGGYGGQGTFSISGNENSVSWYVTKIDEAGNEVRTRATAIVPTMPMYHAMEEMRGQIIECARESFGGGR